MKGSLTMLGMIASLLGGLIGGILGIWAGLRINERVF